MKQSSGEGARYSFIPVPNSKKSNNELQKKTIQTKEDTYELKNMENKYESLKKEFFRLQNQFKLFKLENMTQINRINYNINTEIDALKKEKEEIQKNNEKIINELTSKIELISIQNQTLENNYKNLNDELKKVQVENQYLKSLIRNENYLQESNIRNNENSKQSNDKCNQNINNKQNDIFNYQPPEKKKNNIFNFQPENIKQCQNISSILPQCIENKNTNVNFPTFKPKEKTYYLFFPEKTEPNYNRSVKKDTIYGAHEATDVQRFHYYPETKKIYTFIGFSDEKTRNKWSSNFTIQNISYDKSIYNYPLC